jgi:hypothetical protein
MTMENRRYITLDDISDFQFECSNEKCGTRLVIRACNEQDTPSVCPSCKTNWVPKIPSVGWNALVQFRKSLCQLTEHLNEFGFKLTLELKPDLSGGK